MTMVDDVTYDDEHYILILELFHYIPKLWPAYLFIALFGFFTLIMLIRNIQLNSDYMHIMVFAGLLEVFGYYTRIYTVQTDSLNPFIAQVLLNLLAPIFVALINYIVVGRLMIASRINMYCMKASSLFKVFLSSDVICLITQGVGGGILGGAKKNQSALKRGEDIILAGLAIQLFCFTIFNYIGFKITFGKEHRLWDNDNLKKPIICVIATNALLYIRNFYRVVEFSENGHGYVSQHEWLYYLFESTPMLLCWVTYCIYHFDSILPESELKAIEAAVTRSFSQKDAAIEMKKIQVIEKYEQMPNANPYEEEV